MPSRATINLELGSHEFNESSSAYNNLSRSRSIYQIHPLMNLTNQYVKRLFDLIFSTLIILGLLSWLVPIFAAIIYLSSKGPIFFKQLRHGKNSEPFYCIKFRTMVLNKESDTKQARAGDPRITALGRVMRKYNLDELPQFLNVLKGEMSVVGPRPHMVNQTLEYEKEIPNYRERLLVKPGITGLAQVNGSQGPTPTIWHMQKRIKYDLLYINKWSFWMDLKIVISTVPCSVYRSFNK